MKIYLYLNKKIHLFFLPETIFGSYSFDVNEAETSKLIHVEAKDNKWVLFSTDDCKVSDGKSYYDDITLEKNNFYVINRNDTNYLIYVTDSDEKDYKIYKYDQKISLSIGGENSNVVYNCEYSPNLVLRIDSQDNGNLLLTYTSGYLYLNKSIVTLKNMYIKSGDEIELFGAKILFIDKIIVVIAKEGILEFKDKEIGFAETYISADTNFQNIEVKDKDLYEQTDYFSKTPRIRRLLEDKTIEITPPPNTQNEKGMPVIFTIGPMLAMAITSVITMSSSISKVVSGESDISKVSGTLIVSIVMILSTIMWPIIISKYSKKVKAKQIKENIEKYHKYLQEKEKELQEENKLEKAIITENVISIDQCIENLKHRKLNFWDKRIDQNDFLVARLGVGTEKLKAKINFREEDFVIEEDKLKNEVHDLIEKYKNIDNMPIGYSFYENVITAIMGNSEKCHYFTNNILFQLLTFYSYDDLKLVVFTNDNNKHHWEYIKYLNHNTTNDGLFRYFASNEKSAGVVADVLKQEISTRMAQLSEEKTNLFKPHYLIIVDDLNTIKKSNLLETITELKSNIGFSIIILESSLSKLPSLCNNFINIGETTSGILKNSYEKQEQTIFQDEINYKIDMMEVARILANIPIETGNIDSNAAGLPEAISFLEMMKVGKVEQLNIMNRWDTNDSTTSLKAEVGVGVDGKPMYLDLHEKAHGPHGLIAGMTGSGKSEFIITWILSLCANFSPEDVSFILIDYKGGGLAGAFENELTGVRLPHLTGTITNLDKAEINRTLVSIDSEVKRRQQIFNDARDQLQESTMDIYKYQRFYHDGRLKEPLPHLFIVCDEFAELKMQQPEFMDNLISVARIGRSLGVHLILATQKPSGVVNDQIWSNTKFRVCLKVQDTTDSNEMLKKPDAASLKEAGRFYLQVGYDEYYALGQSGWCGAKYYPSDTIQKIVDKSINIVDENGLVLKTVQSSGSEQRKEAQGEQLQAILNEIVKVSQLTNKEAKRLWLPNVAGDITVEEIEKKYNITHEKNNFDIVIGEYDAPETQSQYPLIYNLLKDGSIDLVGIDSQENEELITTFLYNIMRNYAPNEVSYYIVDYGSQNYLKYEKDPHCGGVVSPGDNEKFANLLKLLLEEQRERKKVLSTFGGEYIDYISKNPGKMPIMFVVFNNYDSISDGNDLLYEHLGELLRDSYRYGIVYLISSSSPGTLPERFRQLVPNTLALSLKEASDYSFLFPGKNKVEARDIFGRGICLKDILHEYQIAFITKDRSVENQTLLGLFDKLNSMNLEHSKKIPVLPEQVLLEDVKHKLKGINKIPVGIEKGNLNIHTYNLTTEIGKLVLTNKIKNIKSIAISLIEELNLIKENVVVIDVNSLIENIKTKVPTYVNSNFDKSLDAINDFIKKKSNVDTTVVIIGLSKLVTKLGTDKINDLFNNAKETTNNHILIFDEANKLKDYSYDDWFKLIDVSEGIYIGPGVEDQGIFKISNYSKDLTKQYPKNYGYYIEDGIYYIIKLIEFERIEDDEDEE